MLKFDMPKAQSSIIKVVGVGGGGNNAVNHMFKQTIKDVDFIQCNTDAQALESSPVPIKIQLGTKGLGAGAKPEVGRKAAEESIEQIRELLEKNTQMLFITAGMGGGTGTGAAPVIASVARELDILTVGIVTIPFSFEGRRRKLQAEQGIEELRKYVDTLLIINNDKLRELFGDLKLTEAFDHADNVLTTAAKGIAELITVKGYVNVDFEDVKTVMKNSGKAIMGSGSAEGEKRALDAIEGALSSPLLNDSDINGAQNILLYIASGTDEVTMDEVSEMTDYIQQSAGLEADIIWGTGIDESLGSKLSVTLIATGFDSQAGNTAQAIPEKKINTIGTSAIPETRTQIPVAEDQIRLITPVVDAPVPTNRPEPIVHLLGEEIATPAHLAAPAQEKPEMREPVLKPHTAQVAMGTSVKTIDARPEPKPSNDPAPPTLYDGMQQSRTIGRERVQSALRGSSWRPHSATSITNMENEPAYQRRNVTLSENTPSTESSVSRYTLTDDNGNPEIKGNSFLHDNVD